MSGTFHRDMIVAELAAWWLDTVAPSGPARDVRRRHEPRHEDHGDVGRDAGVHGEGRARRKVAVGAVEGRPRVWDRRAYVRSAPESSTTLWCA